MSSAALAKKRRANLNSTSSPMETPSITQTAMSKMTIPQAFSLIDVKIKNLQLQMDEYKSHGSKPSSSEETKHSNDELKEVVEEYETRFEMITKELSELTQTIASLATTVTKLQTYTMDVNKLLLDRLFEGESTKITVQNITEEPGDESP